MKTPEPVQAGMQEKVGERAGIEERLERGEVVYYPVCPFPLPLGDDRQFLYAQQLGGRVHKNISYDPHTGHAAGYLRSSAEQAERLRQLLADFAAQVTGWLSQTLPRYAAAWQLDRVSYRPDEEATRKLSVKARNDLLHVDAFPSRPSNGYRILRVFANINATEPRVWITTDPFAKLFEQYADQVGLPTHAGFDWARRLPYRFLRLFRPGKASRSLYDDFMLRFHDFLKMNERFQERTSKQYWKFPPGSAWMAMTDTASHAVLRGRYALEHSYFIAPQSLSLPDEAPAAILERACQMPVLNRAA
jgi:hypothetical protein